jgi:hypothetical protein
MRVNVLLGLLGLSFVIGIFPATARGEPEAAAGVPASAHAEPAAPKRTKISCSQYRANAEARAQHAVFNTKLKAGAWGNIPAPLRRLPSGAKLCGADGMGQAVIVSPLFGREIEAHYTPLFSKIGFAPLACKVIGRRTQCTCKRHRDIGIVVTDQDSEAFVLAVLRRS